MNGSRQLRDTDPDGKGGGGKEACGSREQERQCCGALERDFLEEAWQEWSPE